MCLIAYFLFVSLVAEYRCIDQRHKVWNPIFSWQCLDGLVWVKHRFSVYHCSSFCALIITPMAATINAPAINCWTLGYSPHDTCLQPHSASSVSEKWCSFQFVLFQHKQCTRRQHELPLSAFKPIWMWYGRTSAHKKWKHEKKINVAVDDDWKARHASLLNLSREVDSELQKNDE